jgi:ABC-type transport system substrate-binding protein
MGEESYWTAYARRRLARRSVLRGTLGLAGLAAAGGLTACTTTTTTPTVAPAAAPTTAAVATPTRAAGAPTGGTTVGGKQILYARFLSNPPNFAAQPKQGGTLTVGTQYRPPNFNPLTLASVTTGQYIVPVYNRLLRGKFGVEMNPYDPWKFEAAPELAESWTASPDGTEYTFKIRQGVKFQNVPPVNGRDFTAEDAKWSLENIRTDIQDTLKSANAQITAPDRSTLRIKLNKKVSWLIPLLSDARTLMVPKELADMPNAFQETAIGTGPFILKEYQAGSKAVYAKNPDYFERGKPYLDGFELHFIVDPAAQRAAARGGQVDMVMGDAITSLEVEQFVRTSPDLTVFERDSSSGAAIWHLSMRIDKAPFNDVRVRRALSMAINRKAISDTLYGGKSEILLPFPWTYAYDSPPDERVLGPWYKYDLEAARRLLTEAGVQPGTKWEFLIGKYGQNPEIWAQLIQADLRKLGIEVELVAPDTTTYVSQYRPLTTPSQFPHLATGIVFTNPVDPTLNLLANLRSGSNGNTDQIKDTKMDDMIDKLAAEPDAEKQKPMLRQIWEHIADQAYWPAIPEARSILYYNKVVQNYLPNYRNDALHWGMNQAREIWLNK